MSGAGNLRIWIADDEDLIRRSIRRTLNNRNDVFIVGESASSSETVLALGTKTIDLLLLDVQMLEGSGFDVIAEVGPEAMPRVVFITAFDRYAVKAFEVHALDYLLKPFDEERLNRSIDRVQELITLERGTGLGQQLRALLEGQTERWPERLSVRSGERFDLIPVESIDWIESANNYVMLHCGTRQHLLTETLTALTAKLDPKRFVRVHRGRTVNVSRILSIHPLFSGKYELELSGGVRISSGRQFRAEVHRLLEG